MTNLLQIFAGFIPLLATIAIVVFVLSFSNWFLRRRWHNKPDAQFRFQLIMLALSFAGLLAILVAMPIKDVLRGQLLSLIGILLSAAIALSSTTFIGNIMAGIMLKIVKSVRPGDFITVADLTGRITEMDLLHTEIQTEYRDLVTVPNMYMVTQPLRVVRSTGTIIQAEVSLGYEIPYPRVVEVLGKAAEDADLSEGFVQVRELGDYSVTYRVAGLLEDVTSLISARSKLRCSMLDALHTANIEVVSPTFMNSRILDEKDTFIPRRPRKSSSQSQPQAEDVAFDKAEDAASIERIRTAIVQADTELEALEDAVKDTDLARREELQQKKALLADKLREAEETIKARELADKESDKTLD